MPSRPSIWPLRCSFNLLSVCEESRGTDTRSRGSDPRSRGSNPRTHRIDPRSRGSCLRSRGIDRSSRGNDPLSRLSCCDPNISLKKTSKACFSRKALSLMLFKMTFSWFKMKLGLVR